MKYIRCFMFVFLILFTGVYCKISILSMNTDFSTEALLEAEKNSVLSNLNIEVCQAEPEKHTIDCFDVNEDGTIALGYDISSKKVIAIYSNEMVFQYAYQFQCEGLFGVEWDEDILLVYLVRSDVAIAIDADGTIQEALKIQNTGANNTYWNHYVFSNKRIVGDRVYWLKNDIGFLNAFSNSYSQLIVENNGENSVVYDAGVEQLLKSVLLFAFFIIFVVCIIFILTRYLLKNHTKWLGTGKNS